MDYPTREQAEALSNCLDVTCPRCSVQELCSELEGPIIPSYGKWMLAMHDALDAKQAELDKVSGSYLSTYGKLEETQVELDKAKDFIGRIKDKLKMWCGLVPWANEFIAEAESMTKEG